MAIEPSVRDDGVVTMIVRRRVRPDAIAEFEEWLHGVIDAASVFAGHGGALVLRPEDPRLQDYVLVVRFVSAEALAAWERSEERKMWLARVEPLTVGRASVERVTGLEYWFHLPANAAVRPPPRIKMAIVTLLAIYPLVLFVVPNMSLWLAPLPRVIATLLTSMLLVALMTWVVMPALTRLFARWLFPPRA